MKDALSQSVIIFVSHKCGCCSQDVYFTPDHVPNKFLENCFEDGGRVANK